VSSSGAWDAARGRGVAGDGRLGLVLGGGRGQGGAGGGCFSAEIPGAVPAGGWGRGASGRGARAAPPSGSTRPAGEVRSRRLPPRGRGVAWPGRGGGHRRQGEVRGTARGCRGPPGAGPLKDNRAPWRPSMGHCPISECAPGHCSGSSIGDWGQAVTAGVLQRGAAGSAATASRRWPGSVPRGPALRARGRGSARGSPGRSGRGCLMGANVPVPPAVSRFADASVVVGLLACAGGTQVPGQQIASGS
jgi:hypothetical protein